LAPSGVNLHSGDVMHAHITYDGTTLTLTLIDTVTGASFTASQAIDIPTTVGGNLAYVGFTAGTGGLSAVQQILSWTYLSGQTAVVNDAAGFASAAGMTFEGVTLTGGTLELTNGAGYEDNSVWEATPVNVQNFTTDFSFQETAASADGFTFAIQNAAANALGKYGGGLGYAGIASSVAVKFDLYSNSGEGPDSTGFYVDGAYPSVPALNLTPSGVNLHGTDILRAHINYDGTTLTLTLTDTVTGASFTASQAINIPATVGGNSAYVGFTAGTGGLSAVQQILNWTYVVN
jgi:Bacterial lectin